jgi:CRISPR-associated protein Cst2
MTQNNNQINCLAISCIFKTSIGSINGGFTEGNITTIKKITTPDGSSLPYISGQAIRRYIRDIIKQGNHQMSEVLQAINQKGVDSTSGDPYSFIDDDLFGYLITDITPNRHRTAPVRVSPAIGLFPYIGDRDLGVKPKEGSSDAPSANMFEAEIYNNFFRFTILLEIDRIGEFQETELVKKELVKQGLKLKADQRLERIKIFLDSLFKLWGGGKQNRFLTDLTPKFLIATLQTAKVPIFLESINVSKDNKINTEQIEEVLGNYKSIIKNTFVTVSTGFFSNEEYFKNNSVFEKIQIADFANKVTTILKESKVFD